MTEEGFPEEAAWRPELEGWVVPGQVKRKQEGFL